MPIMKSLMLYIRAWRAMLIPAVTTFIGLTWLFWPLDILLWLAAAGVSVGVFIIATFICMALDI